MEKDKKYRESEKLNKVYSDFCNVIHANHNNISTIRLRLQLIKILNIDKPFPEKVKNFCNHIFSKTLGISKMDADKVVTSWNLRTKLEKNRNYIYTSEISNMYEHLSNVIHGELEKHSITYIKECETKVDDFFIDLKGLYNYKLQGRQISINLQSIEKLRKKRIITNKKARESSILFFKSTFNGRRIAVIEDSIEELDKISKNKYLILKYKSKDIGVFELIDKTSYYTFIRAKNVKARNHYQLYYR